MTPDPLVVFQNFALPSSLPSGRSPFKALSHLPATRISYSPATCSSIIFGSTPYRYCFSLSSRGSQVRARNVLLIARCVLFTSAK